MQDTGLIKKDNEKRIRDVPESFFSLCSGRLFSLFQRYRNSGDRDTCDGTDGYNSNNHFLHNRFLPLMLQYRQISSA